MWGRKASTPTASAAGAGDVLMSGWMTKQGAIVKNWKKRFFVLSKTALSYYKKQGDTVPQGSIALEDMMTITPANKKSVGKDHALAIYIPSVRTYYCHTESDEETEAWISAINTVRTQSLPTGGETSLQDFHLLRTIGKGTFGKVMLVRHKGNKKIFAMKVLKKDQVVSKGQVENTLNEREIMKEQNHPFLVRLEYAFQNSTKLYMVTEFVNGGELFFHLTHFGPFKPRQVQLYVAMITLALAHLHEQHILYRDLKPENILMDIDGYLKITDFGLCKTGVDLEEGTKTFCGTPEYLAPEIINGHPYNNGVDWWSMGTIAYELLTGLPPFYDTNQKLMYRKICEGALNLQPRGVPFDPPTAGFLSGLLDKNPATRLGTGESGGQNIKSHAYFMDRGTPDFPAVDWDMLFSRGYKMDHKPVVSGELDLRNFDEEFTNEGVRETVAKSTGAGTDDDFGDFSFEGHEAAAKAGAGSGDAR